MRRALAVVVVVLGCVLAPAASANAHPLGNFTINTYAGLRVQQDRVLVRYVVDMAEIPAFQERRRLDADGDARLARHETGPYSRTTCDRLAGGIDLRVDGRVVDVRPVAGTITFPPGTAGLATLRLQCDLAGQTGDARAERELRFRDSNYLGRLGWREITAIGDGTTLVRSDVPRSSSSAELTSYPEDLLASPPDVRTATVRYRPGGPVAGAPGGTSVPVLLPRGVDGATRAFTSFLSKRSLTLPFAAVAVLAAVALGAAHALAPGHGKTVMAAYLLGRKGSFRRGALMGLTVTVTHTAGVLVLGLMVSVSTVVAPERLFPVFGLASGVMLAAIGASLLRRAVRIRRATHGHAHDHSAPVSDDDLRTRSLLGLGFAGGLVPSPSALVVLIGAMAIGRVWLGVVLVVAYGLGMAATLAGAGLLLAKARGFLERRSSRPGASRLALLGRALPHVTAAIVIAAGVSLATRGALQI